MTPILWTVRTYLLPRLKVLRDNFFPINSSRLDFSRIYIAISLLPVMTGIRRRNYYGAIMIYLVRNICFIAISVRFSFFFYAYLNTSMRERELADNNVNISYIY